MPTPDAVKAHRFQPPRQRTVITIGGPLGVLDYRRTTDGVATVRWALRGGRTAA